MYRAISPEKESQTYLLYGNTYNKEEYFKYGNSSIDNLINNRLSIPSYLTNNSILQQMTIELIGFLDKRAIINFEFAKTKTNWAIVLSESETKSIVNQKYSWQKIDQIRKLAINNFPVVENDFDVQTFYKSDQGFMIALKDNKQSFYNNKDNIRFYGSLWEGRRGDSGNGSFSARNIDIDAIAKSLALIYEFESGQKDLNVTKVVPFLRNITIIPKINVYDNPVSYFDSSFTVNWKDNLGKSGKESSSKITTNLPPSRSENWFYAIENLMSIASFALATAGFFVGTSGIGAFVATSVGYFLASASLIGTVMDPKDAYRIQGSELTVDVNKYLPNYEQSNFDFRLDGAINYYGSGNTKAFFGEWSGANVYDIDILLEFGLKGEYLK